MNEAPLSWTQQRYLRQLLQRWELDYKRRPIVKPRRPEPYRTAESTVEAYRYLVKLGDKKRLEAWLLDHPLDAEYLRINGREIS